MGIPATAYVATVGTTGGQWEHMHTQQLNAHQPNAGEQAFVNENVVPTALAVAPPIQATIFMLRHGEAGATIKNDPISDGLRPLTTEGCQHVKALADWMIANGKVPTAIYYSPLVRTTQTAQILANAFNLIAQPTEGLRVGSTAIALINNTAARTPAVSDSNRVPEQPLFVTHDHVIVGCLSDMGPGHKVDRPVMCELRQLTITNGDWTEVQRVLPSTIDPKAVDHLDIPAS
jgi:phosphohistidine phosphatase SixA